MFSSMKYIIIIIAGISCFSCQSETEYQQMLRHEMAKNIRVDSVYLDIYLGMPQQEFYDYCWRMNKEDKMMQGPSNNTVQVDMSDTLQHPSKMFFYPIFVNRKIASLPMIFEYNAWAPWNKELSTEHLLVDVVATFSRWYGEFKRMGNEKQGYVYVRIDGNRQVKIFKQDLKHNVKAIITDLSVDKADREAASNGELVVE